jgi:hypothetical protein
MYVEVYLYIVFAICYFINLELHTMSREAGVE